MNTILTANHMAQKGGKKSMWCEAMYELFDEELQERWESGQNLINKLNSLLIQNDRIEDLKRSTYESEYQQQLLHEYQLI